VDADPALLQRIKTLIAQLGDPKWEQREAAQKKLEEYGKAAQAELQKATKIKISKLCFALNRFWAPSNNPALYQ